MRMKCCMDSRKHLFQNFRIEVEEVPFIVRYLPFYVIFILFQILSLHIKLLSGRRYKTRHNMEFINLPQSSRRRRKVDWAA